MRIADNFYWVGVSDEQSGRSYNSYLLKTKNTNILFDTVSANLSSEYMSHLKEHVKLCDIDYLVVHFSSIAHIGAIIDLIKINPEITIITNMGNYQIIKEMLNIDFKIVPVHDGDTMNLGGYTVKFMDTPNLYWPNTMMSHIKELQVLISGEMFSSRMMSGNMLLSEFKLSNQYLVTIKYYMKEFFSSNKEDLNLALKKIKQLKIKFIAPIHGLVINKDFNQVYSIYEQFIATSERDDLIVIVYAAVDGFMTNIAEKALEYIQKHGYQVAIYNACEKSDTLMSDLKRCKGIIYSSSTFEGDALPEIYNVMNSLNRMQHGTKLVSAMCCYGWCADAKENILVRARQQKMRVMDNGYKTPFNPNSNQMMQLYSYLDEYLKEYNMFRNMKESH